MNRDLVNTLAFFFGVIIAAATLLPHAARAAVNLSPTVPNYSAASGAYRASAGAFTMAPANAGYIQPAVANVGGKPITVPAKLRMAANAGQFAKNAMKLNPWAIAGTLAAAWLLDQGLEWLDGQGWTAPSRYPDRVFRGYFAECFSGPYSGGYYEASAYVACLNSVQPQYTWTMVVRADNVPIVYRNGVDYGSAQWKYETVEPLPVPDPDFDSLPDPLPAVAPELPFAPYMPEGVPVEAPEYDFAPFAVPLGEPYTKPDGSTAQPMASVSPNGDGITVDTYDQPVTDSNGNPAPDTSPQDTQEPQPDPCDSHPTRAGCAELGTPPSAEPLQTLEVPVSPTVTPIGGAGACPADVTTSAFGITFSYQPFCDFATAIRPLIIGFAWLSFAFIVAGTVRT